MDSPSHLRGEIDEGTEKGGFITVMVKDLANLEEAAIRMRLGLCGEVVGRGGADMRKGGEATVELAALEFESHESRVQFLEIEAASIQAQIDA